MILKFYIRVIRSSLPVCGIGLGARSHSVISSSSPEYEFAPYYRPNVTRSRSKGKPTTVLCVSRQNLLTSVV